MNKFVKRPWFLTAAAVVCLVLRFSSLGLLDLIDPTEGRYAVIGQNMYLTGDWITPTTFEKTVPTPFLGKPPLEFWLVAAAYHLFGVSEFSARLPSFLATLCTCVLMVTFASTFLTVEAGLVAVVVLLSSVMGFFFTSSCMTDPVLAAVIAGAYVSFAHAVHYAGTPCGRRWGYGLFASFGLGLLVKGPIAIVLFGVGALPWLLMTRRLRAVRSLPWFSGAALTLMIAAPWYVAAEIKNPGFLRYFLINENLLRFLLKEYGDQYGSSHVHFRGMIWLMAVAAFLPWTLVLVGAAVRLRFKGLSAHFMTNPWSAFILAWALAPCVFFTVSRQVSLAYVFPGLAGFALLVGNIFTTWGATETPLVVGLRIWTQRIALPIAVVGGVLWFDPVPVLVGAGALVAGIGLLGGLSRSCSQPLPILQGTTRFACALVILFTVVTAAVQHPISELASARMVCAELADLRGASIDFLGKIPHSAYFYTRLGGVTGPSLREIEEVGSSPDRNPLVITRKRWNKLSNEVKSHLQVVKELKSWVVAHRVEAPSNTAGGTLHQVHESDAIASGTPVPE